MTEKELQEIKLKHINSNIKLYNQNKDLILLYEEYTQKIAELFDFIRTDNSDFFYTIVFDILMEIGFFSASHNFNSDKDYFSELSIRPGMNIVSGEGVCRNIACFYEDIFKRLYHYPLKMCCYDTYGENNKDTKMFGNHVINLTIHDEIAYGFDIMNHCIFKAINKETLKGIDNDYYLTYMPGGDLILKLVTSLELNGDLYSDINRIREILSITAKQQSMDSIELNKMVASANEFIIERKKILQSFMIQNSELTYEIKKKMLSLK